LDASYQGHLLVGAVSMRVNVIHGKCKKDARRWMADTMITTIAKINRRELAKIFPKINWKQMEQMWVRLKEQGYPKYYPNIFEYTSVCF
jgi:hypothetical protein